MFLGGIQCANPGAELETMSVNCLERRWEGVFRSHFVFSKLQEVSCAYATVSLRLQLHPYAQ